MSDLILSNGGGEPSRLRDVSGPAGVLRAMFAHHAWANDALLNVLEALPAGALRESVPGTYGPILVTMTHTIDVDGRYLLRMEMDPPPPPVRREEAELAELREAARAHARGWDEMIDRLEGGTLHASITGLDDFPDTVPAQALLMVQAINHGNEHRAQICSALGATGHDAPELSGWEFWLTGYTTPGR